MRAKGWLGVAVNVWLVTAVIAQENQPLPQQWFSQKSIEGTFATSAGAMIEKQLRPRGIDDPRVLGAMAKVKREQFVAKELAAHAYEDRPLPIGFGQTISQPFIVAFMTQELKPKPTDKVLEIGTGSGYQAAVLGELVAQVYTIEIVRPLAQRAAVVLNALGYRNVLVKGGDGYKGWPEHAPFDAIIVTAAPDHVPQPLIEQLKEGGRMVIPVGKTYAQQLKVLEKHGGVVRETAVIPVKFVPLTRDRAEKQR
ncbi:MAG TPA: protein-L-isoaspartate(D-aspartate) O-methyltransferase [Chthoniobacterales bacterium]|nr:protein-L-isoaspartate(D-aspartate) O-methyltransferase [Chthoniobacterales bacterium]